MKSRVELATRLVRWANERDADFGDRVFRAMGKDDTVDYGCGQLCRTCAPFGVSDADMTTAEIVRGVGSCGCYNCGGASS